MKENFMFRQIEKLGKKVNELETINKVLIGIILQLPMSNEKLKYLKDIYNEETVKKDAQNNH